MALACTRRWPKSSRKALHQAKSNQKKWENTVLAQFGSQQTVRGSKLGQSSEHVHHPRWLWPMGSFHSFLLEFHSDPLASLRHIGSVPPLPHRWGLCERVIETTCHLRCLFFSWDKLTKAATMHATLRAASVVSKEIR